MARICHTITCPVGWPRKKKPCASASPPACGACGQFLPVCGRGKVRQFAQPVGGRPGFEDLIRPATSCSCPGVELNKTGSLDLNLPARALAPGGRPQLLKAPGRSPWQWARSLERSIAQRPAGFLAAQSSPMARSAAAWRSSTTDPQASALSLPGEIAGRAWQTRFFVARLDLHFEGVPPVMKFRCLLLRDERAGWRADAQRLLGKPMNGGRIVLVPQLAVSIRAPRLILRNTCFVWRHRGRSFCPRRARLTLRGSANSGAHAVC